MEIKNCPFCNGKSEADKTKDNFGHDCWFVSCDTDQCAGNVLEGSWIMNEEEAVAAWNRRAEQGAIKWPEPKKCEGCGHASTLDDLKAGNFVDCCPDGKYYEKWYNQGREDCIKAAEQAQTLLKDQAETDDYVRKVASRVLTPHQVYGDSNGVPPIEEIVDLLVNRCEQGRGMVALDSRKVHEMIEEWSDENDLETSPDMEVELAKAICARFSQPADGELVEALEKIVELGDRPASLTCWLAMVKIAEQALAKRKGKG